MCISLYLSEDIFNGALIEVLDFRRLGPFSCLEGRVSLRKGFFIGDWGCLALISSGIVRSKIALQRLSWLYFRDSIEIDFQCVFWWHVSDCQFHTVLELAADTLISYSVLRRPLLARKSNNRAISEVPELRAYSTLSLLRILLRIRKPRSSEVSQFLNTAIILIFFFFFSYQEPSYTRFMPLGFYFVRHRFQFFETADFQRIIRAMTTNASSEGTRLFRIITEQKTV